MALLVPGMVADVYGSNFNASSDETCTGKAAVSWAQVDFLPSCACLGIFSFLKMLLAQGESSICANKVAQDNFGIRDKACAPAYMHIDLSKIT